MTPGKIVAALDMYIHDASERNREFFSEARRYFWPQTLHSRYLPRCLISVNHCDREHECKDSYDLGAMGSHRFLCESKAGIIPNYSAFLREPICG